jgi:hypothetical protein
MFNFWHAVRSAILPPSGAKRAAAIQIYRNIRGMVVPVLDKSLGGLGAIGKSEHGLKANAGLRVKLIIDT